MKLLYMQKLKQHFLTENQVIKNPMSRSFMSIKNHKNLIE